MIHPCDMRHGRMTGYKAGCRCGECRAASAADKAKARLKHQQRGLPADDPRHGTRNGYINLSCRCDRCKAASRTPAA